MKKILHLFRAEKFTEGFINLMTNFSEEKHEFWVFGENYLDDNYSYLKLENVRYYPRIDIKINKKSTEEVLKKYDLIIYHGIFEDILIQFFYMHKVLLKKLILYFWGGDKEALPHDRRERRRKKYVVENSVAIVTLIPQDYLDLKKQYHVHGKNFCARYNDAKVFSMISEMANIPKADQGCVNIQVGNSATITNNHLEILNLLRKYKEENIKIYMPLSYGEQSYAQKVINYGNEIFGDKCIPIRKFMPFEEYYKFNHKMHIGIFGMKRQQAMGNINALMQFGCKIYLRKDSLLWDFFAKDLGCKIGEIEEINKMDFKKFIDLPEKDRKYNRMQCHERFSCKESIREWKTIFDSF